MGKIRCAAAAELHRYIDAMPENEYPVALQFFQRMEALRLSNLLGVPRPAPLRAFLSRLSKQPRPKS